MTEDTWGSVQNDLLKTVGQNNYLTWIEPLKFTDCREGVVRFEAPSNFVGNWVARNYRDDILQHLLSAGVQVNRIEFDVARLAATARSNASAAKATAPAIKTEPAAGEKPVPSASLQSAPLDSRLTFENFVVGKPNELAHASARRVAEGGPVSFNPLFLYGGVGLGKTHLMHAIAWEACSRNPELKVLYLSAEQFMYRFVRALRDRNTMEFKELFRSVDLLMVDDVQFIAGKDSTQDEFFHTFNSLIDQNKQIIISADRAPGEIDGLEDRIQSRLSSGLVVDLHPTDYELRLGILQQRLQDHIASGESIHIDDGVLEMLAQRISTNVRVLEGALNRLFAFSSLVGQHITIDVAQEALSDMIRANDRRVTVDEIMQTVSKFYNVRMTDLLGPRRTRAIARPRQLAMYLAKTLTTRSLPEIGRRFGGRDHTTVIHAVKRIEALREEDPQVKEDLQILTRTLQV
ncbi:chromosomal replication initiator protein DnaA [Dinoroseobacter sp. S76]|uniref:chromosomal replication initiator protein DnaA n=1 Tax=Dinoroseobacter sp. S76 TaxID=3415124 RepID=UPI003C79EAE1